MAELDPYNPLELEALGYSLLRKLERQPTHPLADLPKFPGAGLYALYYNGNFSTYGKIGGYNRANGCRIPIYVGRAKDPGARKGLDPFTPVSKPLLWQRVNDHRKTIAGAGNLDLSDFFVRVLVVLPIWVPLAESMAIRQYRPLWNTTVQGFGIHAPGSGRHGQQLSHWDSLHPGRSFVAKLKRNESVTPESLLARIREAEEASIAGVQSALVSPDKFGLPAPRRPQAEPAQRSRSDASPRPKRR